MRGTVGEFLIDRLLSSGIDTVHGLPGSYNLGFYDNLYKSKLKVVGTTTEAAAGFAADAYARVHGIGCACVTYCVGGFSIANAIACAYAEKSPVVLISGAPGVKERNGKILLHHMVGSFESQHQMFEKITCANTVLRDPERAGYEIDRVLQALNEYKQPVYIELPRDMVNKPIRYDPYTQLTPKETKTDNQSLDEAINEVQQWLSTASNPVIWAGVECARYGLAKKLIKFAENNNIPVATTILGKSVVNERHPLSLGVYCESTATDEMRKFMDSCDCLIMLGVMMTDMNMGFLPLKYQKRNIIRITSQELQIRNHSFEDVKFVDFCESLFRVRLERSIKPFPKRIDKEYVCEGDRKITVTRLFEKIDSILDKNMAIIADVGDSLFGASDLTVHDSHHFISDAFYLSMGFAVPGALGVKSAKPEIRPIVIVGDGAFQMTGMEFASLVKQSKNPGYKNPPIVFVINNGGYGTERVILDGPFNDLHNWNYEKVPLIVGGLGYKVETEADLEQAVSSALQGNQPTLINVVVDKNDHTPALKRMFSNFAKHG